MPGQREDSPRRPHHPLVRNAVVHRPDKVAMTILERREPLFQDLGARDTRLPDTLKAECRERRIAP